MNSVNKMNNFVKNRVLERFPQFITGNILDKKIRNMVSLSHFL